MLGGREARHEVDGWKTVRQLERGRRPKGARRLEKVRHQKEADSWRKGGVGKGSERGRWLEGGSRRPEKVGDRSEWVGGGSGQAE